MNEQPFIPAEQKLPEITLKAVLLAIILTVILAMSNAYLALKIGILTSASIPAAIISMGILRLFRQSNILENNLVQTAASAGEAVAGGIVYTIPALIIIHFWTSFSYVENFLIALIGGVLGVLFSIPLRRVLVTNKELRFPEGRAIAEVLKSSANNIIGFSEIVWGGLVGGALELFQTGFKLIANSWQVWFVAKRALFGFGAGFSATMIGAGYLIGFDISLSIFVGAIIGWLISIPIVSEIYPQYLNGHSTTVMVMTLWGEKVRYIGIGAMLIAGVWTFLTLLKPFAKSIKISMQAIIQPEKTFSLVRTERDIPMQYVLMGILLLAAMLYVFFIIYLPLEELGLHAMWSPTIIFGSILFILVIGFVFSAITGYFSGMVGVSASPGSSIIIAGILMAAFILFSILKMHSSGFFTQHQLQAAEAITIIIGSILTGIACIANDNIQDLKVGHIVGATPWRQQLMLLLGVVVAAAVIPPIMQLLFSVYGIAGVFPHPGMDPSLALPAPPAALMAAITQAVFHQNLPWDMLAIGGLIVVAAIFVNAGLRPWNKKLSILGLAIGIYLPIASSTPLFIGGLIALFTQKSLQRRRNELTEEQLSIKKHRGILLACGLVAGAALMDVLIAIPLSIAHNPNALNLLKPQWSGAAVVLGVVSVVALATWFYKVVTK